MVLTIAEYLREGVKGEICVMREGLLQCLIDLLAVSQIQTFAGLPNLD